MAPIRSKAKDFDRNRQDYLDKLVDHPNLDDADDYPDSLKTIFLLVNRIRLEVEDLEDLNPQLEENPFNASHAYDEQLVWRAKELSRVCSTIGMNLKTEFDWQSIMSPHVFLSLNNDEDEVTISQRPYHHCIACYRVFRPGTRPLLNTTQDDGSRSKIEAVLKTADPEQICDNEMHLNLPNFVFLSQLRFYFEKGTEVPDATIGLCAYNPNRKPWKNQSPDLLKDSRIEPFTSNYLKPIFADVNLAGPYASRVLDPGVPVFGFALWEAKMSGGDSHWLAFNQLDTKVRSLLNWQSNIIKEAQGDVSNEYESGSTNEPEDDSINEGDEDSVNESEGGSINESEGDPVNESEDEPPNEGKEDSVNEAGVFSKTFVPVVWAFTSVGPTWTVYACYQSTNLDVDAKHFGSSVELWSGNVSNKNKALQLLWIVDILKFWAEYTYKPMIGACLALIKAHRDDQEEPALVETSWKYHITSNEENTRRFVDLANSPQNKKSYSGKSTEGYNRPPLGFKSLSDQSSPLSREPLPSQILQRRETQHEQEIDDFTWFLDRDPMKGNLLIIRLRRDGKLDKPLILLDSEMFKRRNRRIQYPGRIPSRRGVDVDFVKKEGGIFLLQEHTNHFSSKHQFCAILPIEYEAYQDSRRKSKKSSTFERLEKLLDLDGLYGLIDSERISHATSRRSQMDESSEEESDGEDSTGSYEGIDEKDGSGSREETDDEDNTASLEETDEKDETESHEGERAEDTSDNEVDQSSDDGSGDDIEDEDRAKTEIVERWERYLEDIHNAWERHKWPPHKKRILALAWIAIKLGAADIKVYKDLMKMYDEVSEPPIDCMTPVKDFGKSFLLIERKNDFSRLGAQFESLGV